LAELLGKPQTTIKVEMTVDGVGTFEDEVQYVVANVGSFYYELMTHPELMATYVAQAIYSRMDNPVFAFRKVIESEMVELGIDPSIIALLIDHQQSGLDAALYREFITGKYVLAFAGTDPTSFEDWYANIAQAFAPGGVDQYTSAVSIAKELMNNAAFNASNIYITGHSLGGGLASAASMASGFHAYTFNAAGLHPLTVSGLDNNNLSNANSLVTSYKVDWDILSWGQYVGGWLNYAFDGTVVPTAIGTSVTIDSEYDLVVGLGLTGGVATVLSSLMTGPFSLPSLILGSSSLATLVYAGYECHLMTQVIYGMEQLIFPTSWW